MKEWKVFISDTLDKRLKDDEFVDKVGKKLKKNAYTGKPLGYKFLREKRFEGRRLYWLVYEKFVLVLIVAESGKKDQKDTIAEIKNMLPLFMKEAENIYKNF